MFKLVQKMDNLKISEEGIIEGYVTTYNNADTFGDVIKEGAFADVDLSNVVMLYSHDQQKAPIGKWDLELRSEGVWGRGIFNLKQQSARDVYEAIKFGTISGLSVGMLISDENLQNANNFGGCDIYKIDELIEVSPCLIPANEKARITSVKAKDLSDDKVLNNEQNLINLEGENMEVVELLNDLKDKLEGLGDRLDALEEVVTAPKAEPTAEEKAEPTGEEEKPTENGEKLDKGCEEEKNKTADELLKLKQRLLDLEQKGANLMNKTNVNKKLSFGEMFAKSAKFENFRINNYRGNVYYKLDKAAPLTNDLAEPYSVSTLGGVSDQGFIEDPRVVLNIESLFTHTPIDTVTYVYTPLTFVNNATFVKEGTRKSESTVSATAKTGRVKTVATWTKLSEQLFNDQSQLVNIINNQLTYGVDLTVQNQLITGDGAGENLGGISLTGNFTDYTKNSGTATNVIDLLRNVAFKMRNANIQNLAIILNFVDWSALLGLKSTTNEYLISGILDPVKQTIYGIPVVTSSAIPESKFAMGNFKQAGIVYDHTRMALELDRTEDDFLTNVITTRAERRLGFSIVQPKAICYGSLNVSA